MGCGASARDRYAAAGAKAAGSKEWQRPATWQARKEVKPPGPDAPHVVLSTKFEEPWGTISRGLKEILEELGCTVYNPNTDNKEIYGDMADDRWLRTFNENLERVKKTRGFVLQIQQGVLRDKSHMQLAEEMQAGWLQVPRIGYYARPITDHRGGRRPPMAETLMEESISAARAQWSKGVSPKVQLISEIFEPLEGELRFNASGGVEGPARVTFPDGKICKANYKNGLRHGRATVKYSNGSSFTGQYQNDMRHGRGTHTGANGDVFDGDFQYGMRHGPATYAYTNGTVKVSFYEADEDKGPGVSLEKGSGLFWLLKDGEKVRQISQAKAQEVVKEHGLPELPW